VERKGVTTQMRQLITYDLIKNKDYKKLIDKLNEMHATKELLSAWSLSTDKTSAQLLDELKPYVDADDKLKVFEFVERADYPSGLNPDWFNFLRKDRNDSGLWDLFKNNP
jgi:hypothetical protein